MTIAHCLSDSLQLLRDNGWQQGYGQESRCILQAVCKTALAESSWTADNPAVPVFNFSCVALARIVGRPIVELVSWNDSPGRTWAEVEAVFQQAIASADIEQKRLDALA